MSSRQSEYNIKEIFSHEDREKNYVFNAAINVYTRIQLTI